MTLRIGELSKIVGVSIQTLRRWDERGTLEAQRTSLDGHRVYDVAAVEGKIADDAFDIARMAKAWTAGDGSWQPLGSLYSRTSAEFNGRISKLESVLAKDRKLGNNFSLVTSIVGEIGNNSYDHNIGSWPDVMGIFFGWSMKQRRVVLADRGQGVFATLRRVRPMLQTHADALRVAFTEILSGREREHRGNGLKYVRRIVTGHDITLRYQSGDAVLQLRKHDTDLRITKATMHMPGCLAIVTF